MQSKVRRNNALSLLLLLLPYVTTGFLLSDAYINIIMEYHENARKSVEPRAADMQMLVYDAELERLAWKWAQRCVYEHPDDNWSDYKDYGQNLAYVTLRDPLEALYMTLVMWWQEKIGYNIEDDSCTLDY
ncbi:unnamed protein product [Dibothriocephalus latus]|uniref:SCP domain-containing protein n=1 Tax=Dibothriocephalus latus TaxID=60516 RepID=A0A3P7QTQ0_DIBLA|nr:unnamed protein product [Dibothriocephalus latus]